MPVGRQRARILLCLLGLAAWTASGRAADTESFQTLELRAVPPQQRLVPFQNGIPYAALDPQPQRVHLTLSGTWKKERVEVDHDLSLAVRDRRTVERLEQEGGGRHSEAYADGNWASIEIPGVENPSPDRYQGGVWYRRQILVPAERAGDYARLVFRGANYVTDVWINGRWVGTHEGGYTPFMFDVTPYLRCGGNNTLAVRVDNIPWLTQNEVSYHGLQEANHRNILPYKLCDWWNYGGILREPYLEFTAPLHVSRLDVRTWRHSAGAYQLEVDAVVYNHTSATAEAELNFDLVPARVTPDNRDRLPASAVADSARPVAWKPPTLREKFAPFECRLLHFETGLRGLAEWTPETPNLYVLQARLSGTYYQPATPAAAGGNGREPAAAALQARTVQETFSTQFGFRDLDVDEGKALVLLNGQRVFLKGLGRHEVYPGAFGPDQRDVYLSQDLALLKRLNANFLRTGHYPNDYDLYVLADRVGLAVWEEIPAFWFDGPALQAVMDRGVAPQMWLEMLYRDYNRPSILFWGTTNESGWQDERRDFILRLKVLAKKVKDWRFVAQSAVGRDSGDNTHEVCDVVGATSYFGIFYGQRYYEDTVINLLKFHHFFPHKPLVMTEFGIWGMMTNPAQLKRQVLTVDQTLRAIEEFPYVSAVAWWALADWNTMITDPQTMGLVTLRRDQVKPAFFELQRLYGGRPRNEQVNLEYKVTEQVSGNYPFTVRLSPALADKTPSATLDFSRPLPLRAQGRGVFTGVIPTASLPDGTHQVFVDVEQAGQILSGYFALHTENRNDPPGFTINLESGQKILRGHKLIVKTEDDRGVKRVEYRLDRSQPWERARRVLENYYIFSVDEPLPYHLAHFLTVRVTDSQGLTTEREIRYRLSSPSPEFVEVPLPYNFDWFASYQEKDGSGWDFPREFAPPGKRPFRVGLNGKSVDLTLGDLEGTANNTVKCRGQIIQVPKDSYSELYLLGAANYGIQSAPLIFQYAYRQEEENLLQLTDWWGGYARLGERKVYPDDFHYESGEPAHPSVSMYLIQVPVNPNWQLTEIRLPENENLALFALTLKKATQELRLEARYAPADTPPFFRVLFPDNGAVMGRQRLWVQAYAHAGQPLLTYSVNGLPAQAAENLGNNYFALDVAVPSGVRDHSLNSLGLEAASPNGKKSTARVPFWNDATFWDTVPVELQYNHNWVVARGDATSGTGWDFPAEFFPAGEPGYVVRTGHFGDVKFRFATVARGEPDNVRCDGQSAVVLAGNYDRLFLIGCSQDGDSSGRLDLAYEDGVQTEKIKFSNWWMGHPHDGEEVAAFAPVHREREQDAGPGVGLFLRSLALDPKRKLVQITLPNQTSMHIFAMSLRRFRGEKKVSNDHRAPFIRMNLRDRQTVFPGQLVRIFAYDLDGLRSVRYRIDNYRELPAEQVDPDTYLFRLDPALTAGGQHRLEIEAKDENGSTATRRVVFNLGRPGGRFRFLLLPFNHDWISSAAGLQDGTGWDYPAKYMPADNLPFIVADRQGRNLEFRFGSSADGQPNNVTAQGQTLAVAPGRYRNLYLLGSGQDDEQSGLVVLEYADGSREEQRVRFSNWWGATAGAGELAVIGADYHHERQGPAAPGVGLYVQGVTVNPRAKLVKIVLPKNEKLHIFAASLEKARAAE